jgi:zinc protease
MLAQVLGDVPSGRLHKQLTERQLASSTFAFAWSLADPAVMFVGAELAPGQDLDKARQALLEVSESVAKTPISDDELQRARTQWLNGWEQNFTDPENVGLSLSEAIALGDWRLFFLGRDQVRDVTLADVQRVAEAYLRPSNRTLGSYIPTDAPQRAPAPAKVDVAQVLQQFKPQAAAAAVEAFEATPTNIDARTQRFEFGGLKAAVLAKPTRGAAAQAVLSLRFGDEKTLFGQAAAAEAVARLLDKGTATLSRQQVQDRLDALKTQIAIQLAPRTPGRRRGAGGRAAAPPGLPGRGLRRIQAPDADADRGGAQGAQRGGWQRAGQAGQPLPARRRALRPYVR